MEEIIAKLNDNEEEDAGLVPEKEEDPALVLEPKDSVPMEEDVHNSELELEENDVSVGDDSDRDPDFIREMTETLILRVVTLWLPV